MKQFIIVQTNFDIKQCWLVTNRLRSTNERQQNYQHHPITKQQYSSFTQTFFFFTSTEIYIRIYFALMAATILVSSSAANSGLSLITPFEASRP